MGFRGTAAHTEGSIHAPRVAGAANVGIEPSSIDRGFHRAAEFPFILAQIAWAESTPLRGMLDPSFRNSTALEAG